MTDYNLPTELRLSSRLAGVQGSEIFRIMSEAFAMRRNGKSVVILGAGEPDFETPIHIQDAAFEAMRRGDTRYTEIGGSLALRRAIVGKFARENSLNFSPQEIICSTGAKQVLFNALAATIDAGDEVVLFAPFWNGYLDLAHFVGARPVIVDLNLSEIGPAFDANKLRDAISSKTRWIIMNSPSNPAGYVFSRSEMEAIADVIRQHPWVNVISDEVYEHIFYDATGFVSFGSVALDLRHRTLIINAVSKTYSMTGWRIGYGAGTEGLIRAMNVVQSQTTLCTSSISQAAAIAALEGPQDFIHERNKIFKERRDWLVAALNNVPGISCSSPSGAFYVFPSCESILSTDSRDDLAVSDDAQFVRFLLENGVAVVPGSCFGRPGHFRVSYAASKDNLDVAVERISSACALLQSRLS